MDQPTTCRRFDRDGDHCRTCGRPVVFIHSTRRMPGSGDGSWRHVGDDPAKLLADLEARRRAEARR